MGAADGWGRLRGLGSCTVVAAVTEAQQPHRFSWLSFLLLPRARSPPVYSTAAPSPAALVEVRST